MEPSSPIPQISLEQQHKKNNLTGLTWETCSVFIFLMVVVTVDDSIFHILIG